MQNRFYSEFDTERWQDSKPVEEYRTPFQVDRDRVLHTSAFRSLQNKTQVFWTGEYDFYRTRLTHSLEVAQIGRSICHWLLATSDYLRENFYIDSDLVEVACLSHDVGHPPFGHAGERTLNYLMREWGGFEGNAQTLRMLGERIFSAKGTGMNPTRAFADSVMKYKKLWQECREGQGTWPENHFIYDVQAEWRRWLVGESEGLSQKERELRQTEKSLECQIMDWSDDTAYSLNDLSDSVRAGFLTVERIFQWAEKREINCDDESPLGKLIQAMKDNMVDPFVGKKIGEYVRATRLIERYPEATSQRYRFSIEIETSIREECEIFKRLAYEVVFLSPQIKQLEHKGSRMLREMWELFAQRYIRQEQIDGQDFQLLPDAIADEIEATPEEEKRARLVCDFLASMSDGDAVRTYKRLFTPDYGSISDWVG